MNIEHHSYRKMLEKWIPFAKNDFYSPPDRPEFLIYGTGTDIWGMQTHQKAFGAIAVLAADPDTDETAAGISRQELLKMALAMLRYTLHSHKSGDYHCTDGDNVRWGHHWLSSLSMERMLHGAEALWDDIPEADKELLHTMLISECDWLLDKKAVQADPVSPNVPESNLWSGALLHRAALMYPETARAGAYRDKGTRLLLNSISVSADGVSDVKFDGRALKDWYVGANFFDSYALNHHAYLNIGYMVICLSNIAMLHFSYRSRGVKAPPALYQHVEQLWQLVKSCIYKDGRLLRIGGDTRVRYCYCQDYLLPSLLMAADCLGEDVAEMERGWIAQVKKEMDYNGDGSFLSKRCELLRERSPLYFTRLESDRAVTLSMAAYWHRLHGKMSPPHGTGDYQPAPGFNAPLNEWSDEYHGAYFVRGDHRLASFVWRAAEPPTALCLPPDDSSMAEWRNNLTSFAEGNGFVNYCTVMDFSGKMLNNGFVTSGRYKAVTAGLLEENDAKNDNFINHIAFAALPDGRTTVTLQYARALRRCQLQNVRPLNLMIPNDLFNDFNRRYTSGEGWICIDDKLSVISARGGNPEVRKSSVRQIGLKHVKFPEVSLGHSAAYAGRGMLCCDEICISPGYQRQWFEKDSTIFDFAAALVTELDENQTRELSGEIFTPANCGCDALRCVCVRGQDEKWYLVAANFSDIEIKCSAADIKITLAPFEAEVFELSSKPV